MSSSRPIDRGRIIGGFLFSRGGRGVDTDLADAGRDLARFDSAGVAGGVSIQGFPFFILEVVKFEKRNHS